MTLQIAESLDSFIAGNSGSCNSIVSGDHQIILQSEHIYKLK